MVPIGTRELNLSSQGIEAISDIRILSNLPNLSILDLSKNRISEIEGLEAFTTLKELNLSNNQITEIVGLKSLVNLQELDLRNNKIETISGLEGLMSLKRLYLGGNPIPEEIIETLNGLDEQGMAKSPENFVYYCFRQLKDIEEINNLIEYIPRDDRAKRLYEFGNIIANVRFDIDTLRTSVKVREYLVSNVELATQIMELVLELPDCPDGVYDKLPYFYGNRNRWNDAIAVYKKAIEKNGIRPMYITGLIMVGFYTGRNDIIDKYLEISLENEEVLKDPYSLSNVLFALNRRETREAGDSDIALKLAKDHWESKGEMVASLWVNMTDVFIVADVMDEIFEELVAEILKQLDKMHPIIYENLAWYYLKRNEIEEAIYHLKEAKRKKHPGFMAIKDSKEFKALRNNPAFIRLFER